jgi:hypothetical protein
MIRGLEPDRTDMTQTPLRSRTLTAALLALVALAPNTTLAADKPKAEASTKATGAFLTKEQLRTCMAQKSLTAQLQGDLVNEQTALATTRAEITRDGAALKATLDGLDRSNAEAVAAHNELAQAHDKNIDAYQARVAAFNARAEAGKAEREAYGKNCENRRFLEEDEIAIKKGK